MVQEVKRVKNMTSSEVRHSAYPWSQTEKKLCKKTAKQKILWGKKCICANRWTGGREGGEDTAWRRGEGGREGRCEVAYWREEEERREGSLPYSVGDWTMVV